MRVRRERRLGAVRRQQGIDEGTLSFRELVQQRQAGVPDLLDADPRRLEEASHHPRLLRVEAGGGQSSLHPGGHRLDPGRQLAQDPPREVSRRAGWSRGREEREAEAVDLRAIGEQGDVDGRRAAARQARAGRDEEGCERRRSRSTQRTG